MKRLLLPTAFFFILSIVGCKSGNDPRNVLMNFMDALAKKDITGAKKFATKESESMLGFVEMGLKMAPDSAETKKYDKENLEYGDSKIEGDKATVPVKNKKTGETTNYILKKEGTDWKVAFDKATLSQQAGNKVKGNLSGGDSTSNIMNDMNKMGSDTTHLSTDSLK